MPEDLGFGTTALHAGYVPHEHGGSLIPPIYQTSAYHFASAEYAARLFSLDETGFTYSRMGNPTNQVLERRLAELEGGSAALVLASGQAATAAAVLTIASAGHSIVASRALYGGTIGLFRNTLRRFGIETRFIDLSDPVALHGAIDDTTRLVFAESAGNPNNHIEDLEGAARIAHEAGVPLIVDNTVLSPYLLRPFDLGADIVVHSLTKFIGGHGTAIGGAVIESGRFPWGNGRFPELAEPDPVYGGVCLWERFGNGGHPGGTAFTVRVRMSVLRDLGACLGPQEASLFLQGLESLHVRMPRHCENALAVAEWLSGHEDVAWVNYPGLPGHPCHERAKRYLTRGFGAIVGFGVRGGLEGGRRFIDAIRILCHVGSLGDARSLVMHPASTSHSPISPADRAAAGVTDDFVRLSVGLEDLEDLKADLDQALKASRNP